MSKIDYRAFLDGSDSTLESQLFDKLALSDINAKPIFVVCSPRVGSTLIYQALANVFNFSYFSNTTNEYFSKFPAIGVLRENLDESNKYLLSYFSQYGKTSGPRETSEASAIFGNWFGGGHPSEDVSAIAINDMSVRHMQQTFSAIKILTGRDTVSKNPWNSFRIENLSQCFPDAVFIWIRRSIEVAAISDLENRVARGNPAEVWNSATTSNYKEIQSRPYNEQVVLQQYYYAKSIESALNGINESQVHEVWYEDLCNKPKEVFKDMRLKFEKKEIAMGAPDFSMLDNIRPSKGVKSKLPDDFKKVQEFILSDDKYSSMRYSCM